MSNEEIKKLEIIKNLALVKASVYRSAILCTIGNGFKTPTEISAEADLRVNHVSKSLLELKKLDLVKCLNEECSKGRLYELTERGSEILDYIILNSEKYRNSTREFSYLKNGEY